MTDLAHKAATYALLSEEAINRSMQESERSRWGQSHFGVSDIGHCREYVRRILAEEPQTDVEPDSMPAFVGTAVGDLLERTLATETPGVLVQQALTVALQAGPYVINLPGTADVVFPKGIDHPLANTVVDDKTKAGLALVRRTGPTLQQRYQVTLYTKALIEAGVVDEDATCMLAYFDRSGTEGARPHVEAWTYDPAIVAEAGDWLHDALYAYEQGEEASKDKPREWCLDYCPFATGCRVSDTDVTGVITDEETLTAIKIYQEAGAEARRAKRDQDSAKEYLRGKSGHTEDHTLRWVTVDRDAYEVAAGSYEKISLVKRKSARRKS